MLLMLTSGPEYPRSPRSPGPTSPWRNPAPASSGTARAARNGSARSSARRHRTAAWQRENPAAPGSFVFTARGTARKMSTDAVAERIRIHAAAAAAACPGIAAKNVTPHSAAFVAMRLQSAGVGGPSIALLLGHESPASTRPYLHADLELKQRALDRTAPPHTSPGRYTPPTSSSPSSKACETMPHYAARAPP